MDDITDTLTARATYTDGFGDDKDFAIGEAANMVLADTRNKAPVFPDLDTEMEGRQTDQERSVDENTDSTVNIGVPVSATDFITMNNGLTAPEILTYSLGGADEASFSIARTDGQLSTKASLDKETKDTYTVTVTATDPSGETATVNVTIKVNNVDEGPEIMRAPDANVAPEFASATTSRMVAENTPAGENIGSSVAANDPNGDALTYALGGTDAASFDIDSATGQLSTKAALDYETKASYSVTVTATDPDDETATIEVTINVTNVDEMGTLVLSSTTPSVDAELTATLTDLDGMVSGETWMWYRSMDGNETVIADATSMSYTPVADDAGYYLKVTVTYTDGEGSGKMKEEMTAAAVTAGDPLLAEYDPDGDGMIERADMRRAVANFFGPSQTLSRADMRRLVGIYFN